MANSVLVVVMFLAVWSGANSAKVANLTFGTNYPSYYVRVSVDCDSPTVANRSDLSQLKFYALNSVYSYTAQRNCSTDEIEESFEGFDDLFLKLLFDDKPYLVWRVRSSDFDGLQFQCSITDCLSDEPAVSNTANITYLRDPKNTLIEPALAIVNDNVNSRVNFNCSSDVGYPGGNLEMIYIDNSGQSKNVVSLANFSADANGRASGSYNLTVSASKGDTKWTRYTICKAYNTINVVRGESSREVLFSVTFPPTAVKVKYNGASFIQKSDGSFVINTKAPLIYSELECEADDSHPDAVRILELVSDDYGTVVSYSADNSAASLSYSGTESFTLEFKCYVKYESGADPNVAKSLSAPILLSVRSMASSLITCQLLLLSALALALVCNV